MNIIRINTALKMLSIAVLLLCFLPCLNPNSIFNPIRHYKPQLVLGVVMFAIAPFYFEN